MPVQVCRASAVKLLRPACLDPAINDFRLPQPRSSRGPSMPGSGARRYEVVATCHGLRAQEERESVGEAKFKGRLRGRVARSCRDGAASAWHRNS